MENNELKQYINNLKEYEKLLNDDNGDLSVINGLNELLGKLDKTTNDRYNNSNGHLNIRAKKLHENAVIPTYSKPGDAGLDLTVTSIISETVDDITYGFGLALEIPLGYVGLLFPRSSVRNMGLTLSNSVGVIDSGYRGEIMSTFKKIGDFDKKYKIGERAAQILILPYPKIQLVESNELTKTARNDGGFGHTGV